MSGVLREVRASDVAIFYEHQLDPEATRMAAFPSRDRAAFDAHWARLLADDTLVKRTILDDGRVAGNIGCWEQDGRRLVGYWVGREHWGKGLATRALRALAEELPERPLHACVAVHNVASIRVLEKAGFSVVGRETPFDDAPGHDIEELLFELR